LSVPQDELEFSLSARALEIVRQRPWQLLAVTVAVFALAGWIYLGVRAALVDLAATNLRALLDAQVAALDTWIREKQINVARWADDPRVHAAAARLASNAAADPADSAAHRARIARGCRSPERAAFLSAIESLRGGDVAIAVNLVDRNGTLLATRYDVLCGRAISETSRSSLAPVFAGAATFTAPVTEQERLGAVPAELGAVLAPNSAERRFIERPAVWFSAPVRDERGAIIAVLNIAKPADDRFSELLATARLGQSGEAYAFDASGRMLSQSRFRADLEEAGKLREGESEILQLRLEDPDPEQTRPGKFLTDLIGTALSRRSSQYDETGTVTVAAADTGEQMEPYPNYVGQRVVGAWRWLPQYNFGVAIEIAASEAFAPLRRLQLAFGSMIAAAAVASLFLLVALGRIVRLRTERELFRQASQQVGNYELFDEIGAGGGARVYRARHRLLKRPTAIKVIHLHRSSDELLARFDREVRLASQLMHPNTIEIYDFGRTPEGLPFYAMELLDGLTLEQLVTRDGPFPAARCVHLMRAIAGALWEAHERGLVHRDVTPSNIMLCAKGGEVDVPKLLDFGLIKDTRTPHTRELTRAVLVIGTPPYLAPERFEKPESADVRSDLYALGAVGYFLLAGKPPFEATTDLSLAYHVVHTPPRPLGEVATQPVPEKLANLILQCLAKRPEDRPQNAAEIAAALDAISVAAPWPQSAARAWWEAHPLTARAPAAATA
jgi:serine/threonine-protein kinase